MMDLPPGYTIAGWQRRLIIVDTPQFALTDVRRHAIFNELRRGLGTGSAHPSEED